MKMEAPTALVNVPAVPPPTRAWWPWYAFPAKAKVVPASTVILGLRFALRMVLVFIIVFVKNHLKFVCLVPPSLALAPTAIPETKFVPKMAKVTTPVAAVKSHRFVPLVLPKPVSVAMVELARKRVMKMEWALSLACARTVNSIVPQD